MMRVTYSRFVSVLFLGMILVYFSQGALYPQGSILSVGSLLLLLGLSSVYSPFAVLNSSGYILVKIWFLLFLINVIGYLITFNYFSEMNFGQMKVIGFFFLSFFTSFHLVKKGALKEQYLLILFLMMLPIVFLNFQLNKYNVLNARISSREEVVNNLAYMFTVMIPYVFLIKRRVFAVVTLLVILLIVIQGAKRGAILVSFVGALVYAYYVLFRMKNKNSIYTYFFSFFIMMGLTMFLYYHMTSDEFLINRMLAISEGGSGRDRIYKILLFEWYNSDSIINYVFGFGFASTVFKSGSGHLAHNDWLELLTNFGLVGFFLYLSLFFFMIKMALEFKVDKYKYMFLCLIAMWFFTTLFSMVYTSYSGVFYSVLFGFLVAKKHDMVAKND
mgnify:CR=1 FL=1